MQESPLGIDDQDLAHWLREAARRRRPCLKEESRAAAQPSEVKPRPKQKTRVLVPVMASVTALAYLQYYYADVLLQIYSLPRLMVFILVDGLPPPV